MQLYSSPRSKGYWRTALEEFRKPRTLTFSALMIAACAALSHLPSIPVSDGIFVTWGFLARAVCGMVGGPLNALVFGFAEDTVSFFLKPSGPYFPGYCLTTMLGTMIYALFLYRARITVLRVFLAKLCTNALNVALGALWSAILYQKGYLYQMARSAVKNTVMLPIQTVMLVVLLMALMPVLTRAGLIPKEMGGRFGSGKGKKGSRSAP